MSETTTESVTADTTQDAANAPATGDQTTQQATIDTSGATDAPTEQAETKSDPGKPDPVKRRIANLTRKVADEARAREAAERELAATRALLQAGKEGESAPKSTQPDLEARAAQLVAEREFNTRLSAIDTGGKKEFGGDQWEQAKATMTSLGATSNQAFLQALAESENPEKLFVHFADDTDALMDILGRGPTAMAARIGRLDASLSKPAPRPLSNAPTPPPKVTGAASPPPANPHDYPANMSMREWNKMMDAHLPPSLGGKKKAS